MKKTVKGSYTIEMAMIMPVLLLVLFVAVTLTFYFYDKCMLAGMSGEVAVTVAEEIRNGEDDFTALAKKFQSETNKKLLFVKGAVLKIEEKGAKVVVSIRVQKGILKIEVYGTATIRRPEDYIRICKEVMKDAD